MTPEDGDLRDNPVMMAPSVPGGNDPVRPRHCLPETSATMLSLQSPSAARWLSQVDAHLDEVLIDGAHDREAGS
jgi:hypothetical protein